MLTLLEYRYDLTSIASKIHRIQQRFRTSTFRWSNYTLIGHVVQIQFFLNFSIAHFLKITKDLKFKYLVRIPDICVKMQIFNRLLEKGVSITFFVCVTS